MSLVVRMLAALGLLVGIAFWPTTNETLASYSKKGPVGSALEPGKPVKKEYQVWLDKDRVEHFSKKMPPVDFKKFAVTIGGIK